MSEENMDEEFAIRMILFDLLKWLYDNECLNEKGKNFYLAGRGKSWWDKKPTGKKNTLKELVEYMESSGYEWKG